MALYISMLRGINVGGHKMIKMAALCELYQSLGHQGPRSYVQSGNVIFESKEQKASQIAQRIEHAVERAYGFRPAVIIRTIPQIREVLADNPFANRPEVLPSKLLITFLASDPGQDARKEVLAIETDGEELRIGKSEIYVYYPEGAGRSKLSLSRIERGLKVTGTARNLNTVLKLLALAETMEGTT